MKISFGRLFILLFKNIIIVVSKIVKIQGLNRVYKIIQKNGLLDTYVILKKSIQSYINVNLLMIAFPYLIQQLHIPLLLR
jgi:hypothetical protein